MNTKEEKDDPKVVHAQPTKDFFVRMITRDIALEDCILDLLDNAIDGARRMSKGSAEPKLFMGYGAEINFDMNRFVISDNCGGIRLSDAIDYAFHFGRKSGSPADVEGGIGLYGIGMKRAIFKIGKMAAVRSEAEDACFTVSVDVAEWEKIDEWDFDYADSPRVDSRGTMIEVTVLNEGISAAFSDPVFKNNLIKLIARDYAFFIDKGFSVKVGGDTVPAYSYQLKSNADLEPAFEEYSDDGVTVRIVAGLADELFDDIPEELTLDKVDRYGWFVVCNDRIVLAANKSDSTVWGDDGYRVWHPQYNGFAGFVFFQSKNQAALPWTTTKREVDASNPLYRRALKRMKTVTDDFVRYTGRRKSDLEVAKNAERSIQKVDVYTVSKPQALRLPTLGDSQSKVEFANINYRRELREIKEVRSHLGNNAMSYRDVGVYTFEYFMKMELGK
jgi:hypothetical protein